MKTVRLLLLALLGTFAFGSAASAHVTVQPKEAPAGSSQVFALKVPSEKESATVQVRLEIPAEVEVSRFEPEPDWTYETEKDADGKIVAVTWKAAGVGIGPIEFGQFNFQGKVAADAQALVWKAHQTYEDGSTVDWTGAPDADKPASVTAVTAAAAEGDGHGAAAPASAAQSGRDPLTLSLAIAGLAAGLAALAVSFARRRKV